MQHVVGIGATASIIFSTIAFVGVVVAASGRVLFHFFTPYKKKPKQKMLRLGI
jgi:hypothetical protein